MLLSANQQDSSPSFFFSPFERSHKDYLGPFPFEKPWPQPSIRLFQPISIMMSKWAKFMPRPPTSLFAAHELGNGPPRHHFLLTPLQSSSAEWRDQKYSVVAECQSMNPSKAPVTVSEVVVCVIQRPAAPQTEMPKVQGVYGYPFGGLTHSTALRRAVHWKLEQSADCRAHRAEP